MLVITIIELFLIILFGIRISYTDISTHKAYNKDVLAFFSVALLLQIVSAVIDHKIISVAIINIILTILLSVVFFTTKIWAAGDAKSYITIITLFPSYLYINSYGNLFPSFYILGYTFSLALLYVLIESIILLFGDLRKKERLSFKSFIPQFNLKAIIQWCLTYITIHGFDELLFYFNIKGIIDNPPILFIVNMLLITFVFTVFDSKIKKIIIYSIGIVLQVIMCLILGSGFNIFSVSLVIATTIIIIIRHFTSQYNYRTIKTSEIKVGQILARISLVYMMPSTVKDLPKFTDETTSSRLNQTEVDAIKRWEKSKYGQSELTIVRHIPFTPFMFAGTIIYILLSLYQRGYF